MNTAKYISVLIATLLLANVAHAQGISYNYLEARYLDSEVGFVDGDGIEVGGSYQVDAEWLVAGSYSNQDFDFVGDLDTFEVGIGYILPNVNGFAVTAEAAIVRREFGNDDDNGIKLSSTARIFLAENLEGRGSLNYLNVDDSDLYIELGADYFFMPQLAAGAEVQLGSDTDTISIGVRWFYDQR